MHPYVCQSVCLCVCMDVCMYACLSIYMCIFLYVFIVCLMYFYVHAHPTWAHAKLSCSSRMVA